MNVFLNLWGGEGYLSGASVLALASVGIYDGIKDAKGQPTIIKYGCYDFASPQNADLARCNEMYDAYKKYYCKMISGDEQNEGVIEKQPVTIQLMTKTSIPQTLETKYNADRELLAYGCSESDITTNLTSGIYGKPWVGEAYYADSQFGSIYNGDQNSMVVINCGGYKGGGTAATFIPLENEWDPYQGTVVAPGVSASKFDVIVGPSTQFNRFVKYPNTGIYPQGTYDKGVDLFEIPRVLITLNDWGKLCANPALHTANVNFLETEYKKVFDPGNPAGPLDRRSLNPINYMPRFIDRVESDVTINNLSACFINLKPNLTHDDQGCFNYDETSPAFSADNQKHKLHITNLLSAVEVQEIAKNHSTYNATGKIYTFQQAGDKFTLNGVFGADDEKKILRFIIFSLFFTEYLCNVFNDIAVMARADAAMLERWAQTEGKFHATVCMPPNPKGTLNEQFAIAAKKFFVDMAHEYIKPTLQAFLDFHDTCPDVDFFSETRINTDLPKGAYGVVEEIISKIQGENESRTVAVETSSEIIKNTTERCIAALVIDKFGLANTYNAVLAHIKTVGHVGILKQYQASFPQMGTKGLVNRTWSKDITPANVEAKAHVYCKDVIKYTYDKVCELFV